MLERLHEHVVSELGHSSRTDTIFIVVAVLFNLIALGINSAASGTASDDGDLTADVVLAVFILMTLVVNAIAMGGLFVGRQTRGKLLGGLVAMYVDNEIDKYYDKWVYTDWWGRAGSCHPQLPKNGQGQGG